MQLPLNVSPVSASFFGLLRRGIHLVLCVACSFLTYLVFCICLVFLDDSLLQLVLQYSLSKIEGIVVRLFRCMVWGATPNLWRVETSLVAGLVLRVKAGSCSTWEWISRRRSVFPRKEVIQPHLPVRLPCYDFTPITDPTLDACLSCELAQRLQVLPTFVV